MRFRVSFIFCKSSKKLLIYTLGAHWIIKQVHFKFIFIDFSHIRRISKLLQIRQKQFKLYICFIIIIRYNGDSIIYLKTKTVGCVINQDQFAGFSITKYSQILNINTLRRLITMISKELMVNILLIRIYIFNHFSCITTMTCGKNNDLKVLAQKFQRLNSKRTDIYACLTNKYLKLLKLCRLLEI